jgi:hypothetical protein
VIELVEPIEEVGGIVISGGRNVVLIGGHITIPWAGPEASAADRRGLFLRWQTGTVHVEGLLIDNEGGDLSEGIQINAPRARVQLVNLRVEGVHARDPVDFTDNHPDLVQPWGGAGELRIWGFTGSSAYQGIFLKADQNELGRVILDRVNLVGLAGRPVPPLGGAGGDARGGRGLGAARTRAQHPAHPAARAPRRDLAGRAAGHPSRGATSSHEGMAGHGYRGLAVEEHRGAA